MFSNPDTVNLFVMVDYLEDQVQPIRFWGS